ncbi:hypothetical protein A8926_1947 [Saccharopolyspora spinosa]|uniref:Uncharacterized protein n=1 Tax=Saccharopolyspora spinosa TaxID=60894 RepID=A0A2N3XUL4_SACSN|nr:hypothetical protein A8926_1947 [Saccharopolyspora spinosa]
MLASAAMGRPLASRSASSSLTIQALTYAVHITAKRLVLLVTLCVFDERLLQVLGERLSSHARIDAVGHIVDEVV